MQHLNALELHSVVGGKTDAAITAQVTALQTSIKDIIANNNSGGGSNMMMMLTLMFAMRGQQQAAPTVIAAPETPAPSPVININTRLGRHHWW